MTWIKKLVFGPLSVVRSNWLAWLLPSGLMNAYVRYLVAKGRVSSAGSVVLARLCRGARSARTGGGDANPVVIVGPPRVGKSILASRLAARLGFEIVGTDKLRFIYRDMGDAPTRLEFKRRYYGDLIRRKRGRIILEGATFLGDRGFDEHLATALYLEKRFHALVIAIGCADADLDCKRFGIESAAAGAYCWASALADGGLEEVARDTIRRSKKLRNDVRAHRGTYFELSPENFERDLEAAVAAICEALGFQSNVTIQERAAAWADCPEKSESGI